ncbi:MAG: acylphosphatase [Alphaproteobacteria bacterium]|nr:acylphosphatase [Alphaproteobacteria bacterium]
MSGRRVRVTGVVQGVFFRNWAIAEAEALGVTGWVRNRTDGSVELSLFGSDAAVEAMISKCRRGPPAARVDSVEVETVEGEAPQGFSLASTS